MPVSYTHLEMVDHVVNSMISLYRQQATLPIWPLMSGETDQMPGYSSVPVIADAYLPCATARSTGAERFSSLNVILHLKCFCIPYNSAFPLRAP